MTNAFRKTERGNTAIIVLVVLVLVAVGAVAYLSGQIGGKGTDAASSGPAGQQTAAVDGQLASPPSQPLEIKPGNPVVGKVGSKEITRVDVFNFMQTLGPQARQTPIDQLFPLALDQVISAEVITNKVSNVNLDNDPVVKAQLNAAKQQIVRAVFMEQQVAKATTDDLLKGAYDLYVKNFPEIEERKTRHILVKEEQEAKDVIKKLKEGADFAELAKESSIDATRENGGELGYMSRQDQVIPVYIEAAFKQKIGEISSKPVKSDFGYHVIEVQEERMRPPAPFEEAKPFLAAQLRNEVLNKLLNDWRNEADVEAFDINGESIEPSAGEETPAPAAEEKAQ